ncbi:hypothetical protein [Streptomyces sp. NPDC048560]|uniref:hypothetical protein n=1 Tax=Streptomyces sp. NPDC048560 TaxID=3155488 RepID=UPI003431383D
MANQHKHPVRGLRGIDGPLWDDFDEAVKRAGSDRSATLKSFMEWYVGRGGAQLPQPPAE